VIINLQDGLVLWIIPAILAITALLLLLWWIALLIAPSVEAPPPPPPPPPVDRAPVPVGKLGFTQFENSSSYGKFVIAAGVNMMGDIPLPSKQFGIGRFLDEGSGILVAIDEKSISRKHAQLRIDSAGNYILKDTNSTYGTFLVEGNQPRQFAAGSEERVYKNDIIQFGQVVRVRLDIPGEDRRTATRV